MGRIYERVCRDAFYDTIYAGTKYSTLRFPLLQFEPKPKLNTNSFSTLPEFPRPHLIPSFTVYLRPVPLRRCDDNRWLDISTVVLCPLLSPVISQAVLFVNSRFNHIIHLRRLRTPLVYNCATSGTFLR